MVSVADRFSMPSSSGRTITDFSLSHQADDLLVITVSMHSESWLNPASHSTLSPEYGVTVHQAISAIDAVVRLRDRIDRWLRDPQPFSVELSAIPQQELKLSLGPCENLISTTEKPVFRLRFVATPSFAVEWAYVVDRTCVSQLYGEMAEAN